MSARVLAAPRGGPGRGGAGRGWLARTGIKVQRGAQEAEHGEGDEVAKGGGDRRRNVVRVHFEGKARDHESAHKAAQQQAACHPPRRARRQRAVEQHRPQRPCWSVFVSARARGNAPRNGGAHGARRDHEQPVRKVGPRAVALGRGHHHDVEAGCDAQHNRLHLEAMHGIAFAKRLSGSATRVRGPAVPARSVLGAGQRCPGQSASAGPGDSSCPCWPNDARGSAGPALWRQRGARQTTHTWWGRAAWPTAVDRREARFISKLPFMLKTMGTRMNSSGMDRNTSQSCVAPPTSPS